MELSSAVSAILTKPPFTWIMMSMCSKKTTAVKLVNSGKAKLYYHGAEWKQAVFEENILSLHNMGYDGIEVPECRWSEVVIVDDTSHKFSELT
jgi:hypothetical protein